MFANKENYVAKDLFTCKMKLSNKHMAGILCNFRTRVNCFYQIMNKH